MKKVIVILSCLLTVLACKTSTNSRISENDKISLDSNEKNFRTEVFDKEFNKDTTTIK